MRYIQFSIKSLISKIQKKTFLSKILFVAFLVISSCYFYSENRSSDTVSLGGPWKLKASDDPKYKDVDFDDSGWETVQVPQRLEKQGYKNYLGTAWYRYRVVFPKNSENKLLGIYFSNIADSDEVYINGNIVGHSGTFEKNGSITPHFSKIYSIIPSLVERGKPNLIAVRFNKQYGPFVGIFNNAPKIGKYDSLESRVFWENIFKFYLILFAGFVVLLVGLFHLKHYLDLKERKDYLVFSISCFFIFVYEVSLSFFFYSRLDNLVVATKINIISLIVGVALLFHFFLGYFGINNFYLQSLNVAVLTIFSFLTLLIGDPNLNLRIDYIYFLFLGFFILYMFYLSIKYIFFKKVKGNIFIPLGLLAVVITGINDGLVSYGYYYFNLLTAYGFFCFMIGIAISLAKDSTDAFKGEQLKTKTIGNIRETASELTKERNLKKLLENSIAVLKQHLNIARCTMVLATPEGEFNEKAEVYGDPFKEPLSEIDGVISNGQLGPYIIKDVEDTFSGTTKEVGKKYMQMMIVPMVQINKRIGLIILSKKVGGISFTDDDKEFVTIMADSLALAVENAVAFAEKEKQIKSQRDALIMSEKMAAIGQLTSGIGHEINNPINFIISYVPPVRENVEVLIEVLKLYEEMNNSGGLTDNRRAEILAKIDEIKKREKLEAKLPRILRSLDAITDGAKRVGSIVDSLKAYARADTLPVEIDINEAIDKSLIILTNKLKNRVDVSKDYEDNVRAKCYFSINQVIVNLLSNAADAIGEKGKIEIKTQSLRDKIRFSIKDSGVGMTEEVKKKLFTPFFTTKGPGKGTGLGLSISYNIIYDQHHGSIDIQSEPGKESTFTVTIPKDIAT